MNSSKAAVLSKARHSMGAAHERYIHGAHCRSSLQDRETPFPATNIAHLTWRVTSGSLLNSTGETVSNLLVPQVTSPAGKAACDQGKAQRATHSLLCLLFPVLTTKIGSTGRRVTMPRHWERIFSEHLLRVWQTRILLSVILSSPVTSKRRRLYPGHR